tara:strand:- start:180 stop:731 length:552 start_codon:yes stop_codon:yes gene_type:complete
MALTAKQERFVAEYLIDLNATQAAKRAGYSEKTARSQGTRMLTNVAIQAAIAASQDKRAGRTEITQDRVLAELAKIGFSDIRKAVRWGGIPEVAEDGSHTYPVEMIPSEDMDDETAAAITEVSLTAQGVRIKMADKLAALEKIGKHLGMFAGAGSDDAETPSINITLTSAAPVGDIRVTRSKT